MRNFSSTLISKPSPYAAELVSKLLPYSAVKMYPARRNLVVSSENAHFCYLIEQGKIEVRRQDNRVIAIGKGPFIVGLAGITDMFLGVNIRTLSTCKVGLLSAEEALKLIEKEQLWKVLANHMLVISGVLYTVGNLLSAPTSYDIICAQLLELMSEDENTRNSVTAENYIRNKTSISRSYLMKILSSLKMGGYIELERGKLVKVSTLPKKY